MSCPLTSGLVTWVEVHQNLLGSIWRDAALLNIRAEGVLHLPTSLPENEETIKPHLHASRVLRDVHKRRVQVYVHVFLDPRLSLHLGIAWCEQWLGAKSLTLRRNDMI